MFGNIGIGELAVLALVAFLLFGPETCVAHARRLGCAIGKFKVMLSKGEEELKKAVEGVEQDTKRDLHD